MVENKDLLKAVFDLAHRGIYVDVNTLPDGISKEVVYKTLLYIELQNLIKHNGDKNRIEEIESILNPPEETTVEE